MTVQPLLLAVVLAALAALGWPGTARLRDGLGWGAALVLAACGALAVLVPVAFAVQLAGAPWPWALLAGALAAAALPRALPEPAGAVGPPPETIAGPPPADEPRPLRWASLVLLLACAGLFVVKVARLPLWSWDHFAIWGVKARRLVGDDGGLDLGFLAWPELEAARPDHPLGLPLAWLVLTPGRAPEMADFERLHVVFGIGLLLVVRGAVRRAAGSWTWGNLAAAMLALSPLFWDTEAVGLAELPLALWAAGGTALLLGARGSPRTAAAGGLLLGFLPWLKSEGFPLAILLFAALAWTSDRPVGHRRRSLATAGLALAAAGFGAWLVARYVLPPGPSFFLGDWLGRATARLPQTPEIAGFALRELLAADWLLFWPLLMAGWLLAVLRGRSRAAALATVVWLQVAIYAGTALFTYLDPVPHLQAAFFRICAALVPLGLLALGELIPPASPSPAARHPPASGAG